MRLYAAKENMTDSGIEMFMRRIGYTFKEPQRLMTALTHRSYSGEHPGTPHNERLEYLGDAALGLIAGQMLYLAMPKAPEGVLSRLRAAIVSEQPLARYAAQWGIPELLRLGRGEELTNGRQKPSILSDAYEAVTGALFLDGGLDAAALFVQADLRARVATIREEVLDHKTALQEWAQARGLEPVEYRLLEQSGPAHDRRFIMQALIGNRAVGQGSGRSKKEAEQAAAQQALAGLNNDIEEDT